MPLSFSPPDRTSLQPSGAFLLDAEGHRLLDLDGDAEVPTRDVAKLASFGAELAKAFAEECVAQDIQGEFHGGPLVWRFAFAGQETASAALMTEAFRIELLTAGVLCSDEVRLHPGMDPAAAGHLVEGFRQSLRRLRTLLVEHNSYLSGGLRFPFPASAPGLAERGLAIYRFPKLAEVDVSAIDDKVQIAMRPGSLGKVTSSGFYCPTLIHGPFTVEADYELPLWRPSAEEPGCFALFAQNEDSARRYYAQRMSAGTEPHRLVASMVDELSTPTPVEGTKGSFRIVRQTATLTCYHRPAGQETWDFLGDAPSPPDREMLVGAKIWSKDVCGGLTAELRNFRVEGRLAERQVPPVPVVPDPRSKPEPRS